MKKWQALKPGDTVEIVAPASYTDKKDVKNCIEQISSWGLVPSVPKDLIRPDFAFSNSDSYRLNHLTKSLRDPHVKALWCLRGGYGSIRLAQGLMKIKEPKIPKVLIGMSDISVLHVIFNQKWKWSTIHGPHIGRLSSENVYARELSEARSILMGRKKEIIFKKLKPMNSAAKKNQIIKAPVVGGNLCTIHSGFATNWQLNPKGKILFLEEVGERGYSLDRFFQGFLQAGIFKGVKAIVFGDFNNGDEPGGGTKIHYALRRFAKEMSVPVVRGVPSGHGSYQRCLPLLSASKLRLGSSCELICHTGAR